MMNLSKIITRMMWFVLILITLFSISCATRSSAEKKAREAFIQGQLAAKMQSQPQIITVKGDVMNPILPYSKDLTLAKALISARWRGIREPKFITIIRGEESFKIKTSDFLAAGEDLPLEPGDIIVLER